jgi:hypothetical protein
LPAISPAQLGLGFSEDPTPNGGENAFITTSFSHEATGFCRPWSLANDPNLRAGAQADPETVQVTMTLSNFVYDYTGGSDVQLVPQALLQNLNLTLLPGVTVTQLTATVEANSAQFLRFRSADGLPMNLSFHRAKPCSVRNIVLATDGSWLVSRSERNEGLSLNITRSSAYSSGGETQIRREFGAFSRKSPEIAVSSAHFLQQSTDFHRHELSRAADEACSRVRGSGQSSPGAWAN